MPREVTLPRVTKVVGVNVSVVTRIATHAVKIAVGNRSDWIFLNTPVGKGRSSNIAAWREAGSDVFA